MMLFVQCSLHTEQQTTAYMQIRSKNASQGWWEPVTGGFILLGISFKASLPQSAELTTAQKVTNMLIYEQLSEDWEWRQHTHHLTEFLSLNNEYLKQGKNNFPKCHKCAAFNLTHNYSSDQSRQFS